MMWRWGNGEMGKWGNAELGRWGDEEMRLTKMVYTDPGLRKKGKFIYSVEGYRKGRTSNINI
jgi:hypothetical protein